MEIVKINNRLTLVEDSTFINVNITIPSKNIQRMLDMTGARILGKEKVELNYNHNADGIMYNVFVIVRYGAIKGHLSVGSSYDAENAQALRELLPRNRRLFSNYREVRINEIRGIYEFGDCSSTRGNRSMTSYFFKNGYEIQLTDTIRTGFGKKRYVRKKHQWVSNRKF